MSLYNQNLLKRALTEMGKSVLIVAGLGYGLVKALDILSQEREDALSAPKERESRRQNAAPTDRTMSDLDPYKVTEEPVDQPSVAPSADNKQSRLDRVEEHIMRLEKRLEGLIAPLERLTARTAGGNEHFVTRVELNAAMEQFSRRQEAETERRFEIQDRSVQSLRTMMARTDELLEQVIENIESMRITA